ncbi:MAG: TonB-dependent receptor [Bacteroidales bacterium]
MKKYILLLIFLIALSPTLPAQKAPTDANIIGHVIDEDGNHIPFATIAILGSAIGTTSDASGHFQLINLEPGTIVARAQFLGYKPKEQIIQVKLNQTLEVNFILQEDLLGLEEVVVTGDRNETNRTEATTLVNRLSPKLFKATQSITLSEGLDFCPGLRLENNCQNCGFTQVRMNGMEGRYAQILINSRPIFSGLAGVYGLELIPANMIDRVEVIRGGGSALYGSNAIAGTINIILNDPVKNTFEFGANSGVMGLGITGATPASDHSINANASLITEDSKSGLSLYGFSRWKQPFDANSDGFSELSLTQNTTFGTRLFHRFNTRSKLTADFFNIRENRRGGDQFDELPHLSGITEGVEHAVTTGAISFDQFFREKDRLSIFASGQQVIRDSYYGANQSLKDYGKTQDLAFSIGTQYNTFFKSGSLVAGLEHNGANLNDAKMGYQDLENIVINPDGSFEIPIISSRVVADQALHTTGFYAQYEHVWGRLNATAGLRYDHYTIIDHEREGSRKSGNVLSPRVTMKYDLLQYLQARISYSQGYRAPQIFDEDLHIETSGARRVSHINSPDLHQETSHSLMASLDFNHQIGKTQVGFLIEGFYTRLTDAFVNEIGNPDESGVVIYRRVNADGGATVGGANLELTIVPSKKLYLKSGFTWQQSRYDEPQEFDEKRFFRTPNDYGYLMVDWKPNKKISFSTTANYTGKMLVPYFGPESPNTKIGELRESGRFFDLGFKFGYTVVLNGSSVQFFAGLKNLFNSYQKDFDRGISRDPGYLYGPNNPRSVYAGLRFGNFLN